MPGVGQIYMGKRWFGGLLLGLFLASFGGLVATWLISTAQYFEIVTDENVLDRLEEMGQVWHPRRMIGLGLVGLIVSATSFFTLSSAAKR